MKAKELREKGVAELKTDAKKLAGELMKLRFDKAANQTKDQAKLRVKRRDVARILTVLHEKGESA